MECYGAYNSPLTRSIARDLMHRAIFFENIRENAIEASTSALALDDNLMRMHDDRSAGRELISFDFDRLEKLLKYLKELTIEAESDDKKRETLLETVILCAERLFYITKHVTYLIRIEDIENYEFEATSQMFSYDGGEQICGPTDKEVEEIRLMLSYAKKFLHIYLVSDMDSEEEKKAYKQATNTELMARLVAEGKIDEFIEKIEEKKADAANN